MKAKFFQVSTGVLLLVVVILITYSIAKKGGTDAQKIDKSTSDTQKVEQDSNSDTQKAEGEAEAEGEEDAPEALVPVKSELVQQGSIKLTSTVPGRTCVERRERIISPIDGRILEQNGRIRETVKKDAVLAIVRAKESDAALTGAQVLLRQAQNDQQKAEAIRTLDLAKTYQTTVTLTASFDGIIISRSTDANEVISENTELFTIVDPTSVVFVADVPPSLASKLHPGQQGTVRFDAMTDVVYPVSLMDIGSEADPLSQNIKARFRFQVSPGQLSTIKMELAGLVCIETGKHSHILTVPKAALLRNDEDNSYSVITITTDSLSKTIPVEVGASNDLVCEVSSPEIHPGMAVVTVGNYGLSDSTHVTMASETSEE